MLQLLAINQYVLGFTVVGFVIASVMMILIVLVQRPQGGGLSDAFGAGAGGGGTAFGAKTGDALTTGTIGVFILFLALAISLNFMIRPGAAQTQEASVSAPLSGADVPAPEIETEGTSQPVFTRIDDPFAEQAENSEEQAENATNSAETVTPVTPDETPESPVETPEDPQ